MENKRALPRLFGAEFKRSLTVKFLLVPVGVVPVHLEGYQKEIPKQGIYGIVD